MLPLPVSAVSTPWGLSRQVCSGSAKIKLPPPKSFGSGWKPRSHQIILANGCSSPQPSTITRLSSLQQAIEEGLRMAAHFGHIFPPKFMAKGCERHRHLQPACWAQNGWHSFENHLQVSTRQLFPYIPQKFVGHMIHMSRNQQHCKKNRTTSLWKKTQPRSLLFHPKRSAQCSIHQGLDPSTFGQPQSASLFSTLASQLWIHLMHLMPVAVHAASSVPIFSCGNNLMIWLMPWPVQNPGELRLLRYN